MTPVALDDVEREALAAEQAAQRALGVRFIGADPFLYVEVDGQGRLVSGLGWPA